MTLASRRTPIRGAWTLVLVLLLLPAWASAQSQPTDAAQDAFERGVTAYREERFGDAAMAFEESCRLRSTFVARRNLALAYERMGRYLEAITLFDALLQNPDLPADERTGIEQERAPLPGFIVRLRLQVVPIEATLRVDGREPRREGDEVLLDPGRHTIDVRAPGYSPQQVELAPQPGARVARQVRLDELPGRLRIEATVPEATLRIDGTEVGHGFAERTVAPGEHDVEVRATGYRAFARRVLVRHDADVRVSANLIQETSVVSRWWFWTAVGAAAVGATAVGVYFATREDPFTIPGTNATVQLIGSSP